ncbi:MAG: thioesterase family protein [Myxococcota bacterium]
MADGFPVRIEVKVQWGEMDAFAHVNNAQYLRWFESARIAYFEKVAVAIKAQDTSPWVPILARATVDFRRPVTYPDTVTVEASVRRFGTTSFTMAYRLTSQAQGVVAAEGEAVVVLLDPSTGQKTPVPEALKAAVAVLEGGPPG